MSPDEDGNWDEDPQFDDTCHHGIDFSDPCEDCDDEIDEEATW